MPLADLKELIGDKKLLIGSETTLKNLKKSAVKKIFLSANCAKNVKEEIEEYSKMFGAEVEVLKVKNDELGVACKKPFSISVLSLLK
ncbi:ribosomal L7Ae/L30e/S12e/Gadd45 family protein [Nanoarchaeota archaeon]